MSAVEAPVRLGISLWEHGEEGLRTTVPDCYGFSRPLFKQMSSGKYDVCATMPLPRSREAWEAEHRTARKRAWHADRCGYWARPFNRNWHRDHIEQINTSRAYRQGRPMDKSYETPDTSPLPDYPCELHAIRYYGVFNAQYSDRDETDMLEVLVAYMQVYRAGDLMLVSQVLGHAEHEKQGVMYLLFRHALEAEGAIAPGVCVYNRWDSGTDGLRFLKARIGFEETAVEWLP